LIYVNKKTLSVEHINLWELLKTSYEIIDNGS